MTYNDRVSKVDSSPILACGRKLGIITIGQSPRHDISRDFVSSCSGAEVTEVGALDGLSREEILKSSEQFRGPRLVTKLRSGEALEVSKRVVDGRLPEVLRGLEEQVDVVLLACTGTFPELRHSKPLIAPDRALCYMVASLVGEQSTVGVITPVSSQAEGSTAKFFDVLPEARIVSASFSPYLSNYSKLFKISKYFNECDVDLIVLDCMGYDKRHRDIISAYSSAQVILARSTVIAFVSEVLSSLGMQIEQMKK